MSHRDAPPPPDVAVRDTTHPARTARCRSGSTARPTAAGDRPALVWLHGGAFVGGDLDMPEADWVARQICDRAGAVVVSVDYRLAVGGVTYPVPHDDTVAAVRWVRDSAADLGIDPAGSSSAAPAPAATSRPAPPCACATTTTGCRQHFCSPTRPPTRWCRRRPPRSPS